MSIKAGRFFTAALALSLLIQMQIAGYGYAAGRPKIVFGSTRDGNSEIYVMEIDGSNQVRLTDNPANDTEPSWSPDGDRIAFVSNRNRGIEQIFVMDSNGRNLMHITKESNGSYPAWSPDGAKIAFTRNQGGYQIWVMDADGGNQTRITKVGFNIQPAWSPDGARIAFVTRRLGGGIAVMDANGDNQIRLSRGFWSGLNPSWSPDGQWIAYESHHELASDQIFVVKSDGSGLTRQLTHAKPNRSSPAWSPYDDTIAYVSWDRLHNETIHLMTADGKHLKQLSEEHDGADTDPDWYAPVGWSVSPAANFVTIWGEIKREPADQ